MESIYSNQQASTTITKVLPGQNFTWLIAVGASAGGVETFKEFLQNLPEQLINITIFVGFAIDKSNKQLLSAAINSNSSITLKKAKHGEEIQTGIIYYSEPGYELDINGTHLQLNLTTADVPSNPIDKLFKSLAVAAGEKSIAVVLSGMGTDGANGIKILKEAGGYVIAQTPPTAMYNAMPIAAINTNCADLVIPPFQMGDAIWNAIQLQQVTATGVEKNEVLTNSSNNFFSGALYGNEAIISVDTMVKETIFNCYEHTYLIVNSSFIIKEIKGDTSLFKTGLSNLTNQHLWSVIKEEAKAAVLAEVTKATTTQAVAKSSIEIIDLYCQHYFTRIIVKPILNHSGTIEFYLIVFENMQPEKFESKAVQITDTALV